MCVTVSGRETWRKACGFLCVFVSERHRHTESERERERELWVALNVRNVEAFGSSLF